MTGPRRSTAPDRSWHDDADCVGTDPDLWFPARGENRKIRVAKRICNGCPVRQDCLDHAIATAEPFGIRGGLTEDERLPLRTAAKKAARLAPVVLEYVAHHGPRTAQQTSKALGLSLNTAQTVLKDLVDAGRLVRNRTDVGYQTYLYSTAPDAQPD